jgi:hypothetical protein
MTIPEACRGLAFHPFLFLSLIIWNQKRTMIDYVIKIRPNLLTVDFGTALPINAVFDLYLFFPLTSHSSVQRPQLTLNLQQHLRKLFHHTLLHRRRSVNRSPLILSSSRRRRSSVCSTRAAFRFPPPRFDRTGHYQKKVLWHRAPVGSQPIVDQSSTH